MEHIYFRSILNHRRSLKDVPNRMDLPRKVKALLDEAGYDENGYKIESTESRV